MAHSKLLELCIPTKDSDSTVYDILNKKYYAIEAGKVQDFYVTYSSAANDGAPLYFAERVLPTTQLKFNFEIPFSIARDDADPIVPRFLNALVSAIQHTVCNLYGVDPDEEDEKMVCFVERAHDKFIRDGGNTEVHKLRITLPLMAVQRTEINTTIKNKLKEFLVLFKVESTLPVRPSVDIGSSIVDIGGFTVMHGSSISLDEGPTGIECIYKYVQAFPQHDGSYYINYSNDDSCYITSDDVVSDHRWNISENFHQGKLDSYSINTYVGDNPEWYYPIFLSNFYHSGATAKLQYDPAISQQYTFTASYLSKEKMENLRKAEYIISKLSPKFFTTVPNIYAYGKSLYSIDSEEDGLQAFKRYLPQASVSTDPAVKKVLEDPEGTWFRFRTENFDDINTLEWILQIDNRQAYEDYVNKETEELMNHFKTGMYVDMTVVDLVKRLYHNTMRIANTKGNDIVYYQNHCWNRSNSDAHLTQLIGTELRRFFIYYQARMAEEHQRNSGNGLGFGTRSANGINQQMGAPPVRGNRGRKGPNFQNNQQGSDFDVWYSNLKNVIDMLGTGSYIKSIVSLCRHYLIDDHFMERQDKSLLKHAIQNGVIEIIDGNIYFRHGRPNDYLSVRMGWSYRSYFNKDHKVIKEAMHWLRCIYAEPEFIKQNPHFAQSYESFTDTSNISPLLHYVLKVKASAFRGGNRDKRIYIMSGKKGNNSKTTIASADGKVWGELYSKVPNHLLSEPWKGGANPELMRVMCSLMASSDEPDITKPWLGTNLKRLSGNDEQDVRLMYVNGSGRVYNKTKIFSNCNSVPLIIGGDKALRNRMVIIPHEGEWVPDAPDNIIQQYMERRFKMDTFFDEKIPDYIDALGWIYFQYYSIYAKEGVVPTESVLKYTSEYWKNNDPYKIFIGHRLRPAITYGNFVDMSQYISCTTTYTKYKKWFEDYYPKQDAMPYPIFVDEISMHLGQAVDDKWHGWSFFVDQAAAGGAPQMQLTFG